MRSAIATVAATASGTSANSAAISAGGFSTCSRLPRRSASQASSVAWTRIATSASCSGPRRRLCTCTSFVATTGRPSRRASARRACTRVRSPRWNGRCSSTHSRPSNASASRRTVGSSSIPWRAQPVRQSSPPASSSTSSSAATGGVGRAVAAIARVGVRPRDELAQVLVAVPLLDQQRQVPVLAAADVDRQLAAGDRLQPGRCGRLREHERAAEVVVVGQRERRVALQHRAIDQLLGVGGAVEEGEGGVAVELDVGCHRSILYEHVFALDSGDTERERSHATIMV